MQKKIVANSNPLPLGILHCSYISQELPCDMLAIGKWFILSPKLSTTAGKLDICLVQPKRPFQPKLERPGSY